MPEKALSEDSSLSFVSSLTFSGVLSKSSSVNSKSRDRLISTSCISSVAISSGVGRGSSGKFGLMLRFMFENH